MKPTSLRFGCLGLLSLSLLLSTGCATSKVVSKRTGIPFVGHYTVSRYVLDNGLKILICEDHTSPTFAYQTWFGVGSRDEHPGHTGLAHLFEHLMFRETKNLKESEFNKKLEEAGGVGINAFTTRDHTAYIQRLPKSKLDLIMSLESDRMKNLIVNEESFKTEREVVQNERRFRKENNPDGQMYQTLYETAYQNHSYRWPVIGYEEDLNKMSAQEALDFYQSYYQPSNATVVVVGDVDTSDVLSLASKYYGGIESKPIAKTVVTPEEPQTKLRRKRLKLSIQVEQLMMAYHVPEVTHPDTAAIDVLETILTDGKAARLRRDLVESGIASWVNSGGSGNKEPSLFFVMAGMQKGKKSIVAERVILRELKKLSTRLVPQKELDRAKNLIKFGLFASLESAYRKASVIGDWETNTSGIETFHQRLQQIDQVTSEQIRDVAKKYLQPKQRTVIFGEPK